jgi:hypothetical protein
MRRALRYNSGSCRACIWQSFDEGLPEFEEAIGCNGEFTLSGYIRAVEGRSVPKEEDASTTFFLMYTLSVVIRLLWYATQYISAYHLLKLSM